MARTPWAPGASAMAAAARAVEEVCRGRSADAALSPAEGSRERAAVRAIALGTLRWYLRLAPAVEALLRRPAEVSGPLKALLVVAAHQVEYSRNAPEASVHAAVDAARLIGAERASGLVNAVLRRFVSERAELFGRCDADPAVRLAHPAWLIARIRADWPDESEAILAANNAHPPMTLRVDLSRISRAEYVQQLRGIGIESKEIQWMPPAVTLDHPIPVAKLPGFAEGLVSVQDAGAQLAAFLLAPAPGMRVLDACAAPGGKTAHLLERLGEGAELYAVDLDPERTALIGQNLKRLRRTAQVSIGDLRRPESFWDGRPFERILVDAPCSSSGVIRRHPDIKLLRRDSDVPAFAATQVEILTAALAMLAEGGRLVYSTCSIFPDENEAVLERVLAAHPGVREAPGDAALPPAARARPVGVQLLPGTEAGTDGFYYACLEKTTAGT